MKRKQNRLVPIGEVGGLDRPVTAIREASPQARHHFTLADQINQLVAAREADPNTGFMARLLSLCSLPRTNPGNRLQYKRVNGPYTLVMFSNGETKLPYGNIPRLLMAWICTEAVRTQSRVLVLGSSLSKFMRKLGMSDDSGSPRGDRTRLRNQMKRLFGCNITLIYKDDQGERFITSPIAASGEYLWDPKRPYDAMLWESKIELSEKFFEEIIRHPVPLDMNTLKALKRCALGLDLYLWLNYRLFALTSPLRLSWRNLYRQFDADPTLTPDKRAIQNFRVKVLRELKKIKTSWAGLDYRTAPSVLILYPSKPVIPPAPETLRLVE